MIRYVASDAQTSAPSRESVERVIAMIICFSIFTFLFRVEFSHFLLNFTLSVDDLSQHRFKHISLIKNVKRVAWVKEKNNMRRLQVLFEFEFHPNECYEDTLQNFPWDCILKIDRKHNLWLSNFRNVLDISPSRIGYAENLFHFVYIKYLWRAYTWEKKGERQLS